MRCYWKETNDKLPVWGGEPLALFAYSKDPIQPCVSWLIVDIKVCIRLQTKASATEAKYSYGQLPAA